MLYGTSFVAARYAGIRDFLHSAPPAGANAMHIAAASPTAPSKPSPCESTAIPVHYLWSVQLPSLAKLILKCRHSSTLRTVTMLNAMLCHNPSCRRQRQGWRPNSAAHNEQRLGRQLSDGEPAGTGTGIVERPATDAQQQADPCRRVRSGRAVCCFSVAICNPHLAGNLCNSWFYANSCSEE